MTCCWLLLAACGSLLVGHPKALADDPEANTGAQFLRSVIRRIGGKPEEEEDPPLAKPVADLQAALQRVSESMAAAGVDISPTGDATAQLPLATPNDVSADPGPPYVLAPPENAVDPSASAAVSATYPPSAPPPIQAPPLHKDELSALYQAVADKGLLLDLAAIKGGYLPPGQDGIGDLAVQASQLGPGANGGGASSGASDPGLRPGQAGYYYYFLPLKGLGDQKSQPLLQQAAAPAGVNSNALYPQEGDPAHGMEQAAVMSIMNALGADMNNVMGGDSQKSVEPLFMAMAGFIGMALMFVLSVLFLPKWGTLRSRGVTALKHAPDELASLTKLVVQSIEGKDCSERIACEVGRAVRTMRLGNKPLRVLEIILPPNLSKQIGHIRKAARKAEKCNFIPCKYPASFLHPIKPSLIPGVTKPLPNKLPPPLNSASKPPVITRSASSTTPRSKPLPHVRISPPQSPRPMRIKLFTGNANNKHHGNPNKQWQNSKGRGGAKSTTASPQTH